MVARASTPVLTRLVAWSLVVVVGKEPSFAGKVSKHALYTSRPVVKASNQCLGHPILKPSSQLTPQGRTPFFSSQILKLSRLMPLCCACPQVVMCAVLSKVDWLQIR